MLSAVILAVSLLSAAPDDIATARAAAEADHRPLLVFVDAPWCGWCKAVHPWFPQFRQLGHFARINLDADKATADAYAGSGPIPRLAVFRFKEGKNWTRERFTGVDEIRDWVFPKEIFNGTTK